MEIVKPLKDEEYNEFITAKDARRAAMLKTMTKINEVLIGDGTTTGAQIYAGWKDINCFFPYGANILHVRISPVQDNKRKLTIAMRELDPEIMLEERKRTSIGNEHQAQIRIIQEPILIPDTPASIIELLREKLPLPKKTPV